MLWNKASVGPNLACDTQPRVPQNEGECRTTFLTLHLETELFAVSSLKTLSTPATSPLQAHMQGRSWGVCLGGLGEGYFVHLTTTLQLVWGPVASVHWQRDVKLAVESYLCGWALVLFALFKSPNLVKLHSFEISIYDCTVEACLTSKFFVVKDISFILHSSYMMGELKRHVSSWERAGTEPSWLVKALLSGVREEVNKARLSPPCSPTFCAQDMWKNQYNWRQEMKHGRRAEFWQSRGDNEEERRE